MPLLQSSLYEPFKPIYAEDWFLDAFMIRLHLQKATCEHLHSLLSEGLTSIKSQMPSKFAKNALYAIFSRSIVTYALISIVALQAV